MDLNTRKLFNNSKNLLTMYMKITLTSINIYIKVKNNGIEKQFVDTLLSRIFSKGIPVPTLLFFIIFPTKYYIYRMYHQASTNLRYYVSKLKRYIMYRPTLIFNYTVNGLISRTSNSEYIIN